MFTQPFDRFRLVPKHANRREALIGEKLEHSHESLEQLAAGDDGTGPEPPVAAQDLDV